MVVVSLFMVDQDVGDVYVYIIQSGNDDDLFDIDGNQIVVKDGVDIDFEIDVSYMLMIRIIDIGGLFYEEDIMINVVDVNEVLMDIVVGFLDVIVIEMVVGGIMKVVGSGSGQYVISDGIDSFFVLFIIFGDVVIVQMIFEFGGVVGLNVVIYQGNLKVYVGGYVG